MIIRAFEPKDEIELRKIHHDYFKDQFQFPDFYNFINAFVVENDEGKIVSGGGIRKFAELIALTDLNLDIFKRVKAIKMGIDCAKFSSSHTGHDQLHAFIQDKVWLDHLLKLGFSKCKGEPIFIDIN